MAAVHYLDANVAIEIVEGAAPLEIGQIGFLAGLERGEVIAVTSELALAECLVKPMAEHNEAAVAAFHEFFTDSGTLSVVPVSRDILIRAAELRAGARMRLPDAIHVATAELTGCVIVISQDKCMKVPEGMRLVRWTGFRLDD